MKRGKMFDTYMGRLAAPWTAKVRVERPHRTAGRSPLVTVIIPCYNYGHYLPECVNSVLEQEDVRVEVLTIDDASPDGSAKVARDLAAQDSRIRAICHEKNKGHIATYNEGLAQATGDYTVLLSADDLMTPGCLSRATSLMEAHPSVGLTYGCSVDFTDAGRPPARTAAASWLTWPGHKWLGHLCKTGQNVMRSPEAVMRTSVLQQVGGYSSDLPHAGDFEMWMRAAAVSDIGFVGGADQAYYRIHSSNMHHSSFDLLADVSQRLLSFDRVLAEDSGVPGARAMRNTAHRALAREALGHAISAYSRGIADSTPVDDFAAFALSAWPDAKRLREWRLLSRLRATRDRRPHKDLALARREAVRNLRYALGWWRRRWAGV